MVFLLPLLFFAALFSPATSFAGQPLIYTKLPDDLRVRSIASFLTETGALSPQLPYETAVIDLNGDGINEAIFRQKSGACEQRADCRHLIAGISNKEPILLGTIPARKIGISQEKSYGVQGLVVYNSTDNDFAYRTYFWDAYSSAFLPK